MTSVRIRIFASFGVALLVILTGWAGAGALSVGISTREQARRTRVAIEAAQAATLDLAEAQSAAHTYLLTADSSYLTAYDRAVQRPDPMNKLRKAYAGTDKVDVDALAADIEDRRTALATMMRLAHEGDTDAALELAQSREGRRVMERIRGRLDSIIAAESADRELLGDQITSALRLGRLIIIGGMLVVFALTIIVNISLMRVVSDREAWQSTIETQARDLHRQTTALLDHEKQLRSQLLEQKRLSAALQTSNEELDQFAYATSHDLKAPLRGIMNLATWIEEDLGSTAPEDVKHKLGLMRGRAQRLEALIEGILAYSRAGRGSEQVEVVDVRALVTEVVELIAPPAGCEVILPTTLPTLSTERMPLQQVFMNLIHNAIKHGCPNKTGHVEIKAQETAGVWCFSVRDPGVGIAPEFHGRIFGLFQTLSPRDQVEGTGIGLAVVKKVVEARGGTVRVESAVNQGATFYFTWPASPA